MSQTNVVSTSLPGVNTEDINNLNFFIVVCLNKTTRIFNICISLFRKEVYVTTGKLPAGAQDYRKSRI